MALFLIALSIRNRSTLDNQALTQNFVAQPTPELGLPNVPLPQLDFSQLPAGVQQLSREVQQRLGQGQSVPALTPVAQGQRLRVEVREVRRTDQGVQVRGQVTNISQSNVEVPVSAFELRDDRGTVYVPGGGAKASLGPGASTPLDLTVPAPAGSGLLLTMRFPPDPPVEQVLVVADPNAAR
ncbi:MAG: hypothetical protein MUD01_24150 [Chloroflexaceae bacterium]|nr:hypothetical protein [Chloroflexaceae bacterium]